MPVVGVLTPQTEKKNHQMVSQSTQIFRADGVGTGRHTSSPSAYDHVPKMKGFNSGAYANLEN